MEGLGVFQMSFISGLLTVLKSTWEKPLSNPGKVLKRQIPPNSDVREVGSPEKTPD
tara:strand:- start:73 stop:240 length:168 start_codon:yes stop_codon:yes gene_type:complete